MDADRLTMVDDEQSTATIRAGLANLAAAVAGQRTTETLTEQPPGAETRFQDHSGGPQGPAADGATTGRHADGVDELTQQRQKLEHALAASHRWEAIANTLSGQVHAVQRERDAMRTRFTAMAVLSAGLAVWAVTATLLLAQ